MDIEPGDVVVCVDNVLTDEMIADSHYTPQYSAALRRLSIGHAYRVRDVVSVNGEGVGLDVGVKISDINPYFKDAFMEARFRKIRPADPEFVALIKRVKVDA